MTSPAPVLLCLNDTGLAIAARLKAAALPDAEVHGLRGRADGADVAFDDTMAHVRALFAAGRPIIGVCASGILIRAVAPVLGDKQAEPPVVAVAQDGSCAVPLLGGHHGANALARRIAEALEGAAAVTTAGDVTHGIALDEPPKGWSLANPAAAKPVMAALAAGQPVTVEGDAPWLAALPQSDAAAHVIRVTERLDVGRDALVIHPPVLAVGVGCERGDDPAEVATLVSDTLARAGLSEKAVACVCSLDLKADEAAVRAVAAMLGVPARFFTAEELERETPRLQTPSEVVFAEVGCHGVSEGAALAAAGPEATLIVPKKKTTRATCAVALAPTPIDAGAVGRGLGRLTVVGIGPGQDGWRTPAVSAAVAGATDLVGYGLYLDLLGPAAKGKTWHQSDLGAEADRARVALDLAGEGRDVALVCSGDAGIYALATLVFELIATEANPAWRFVDLTVEPGVSAIQAAAARSGAPIGHDFCTISLSDLLTPWDVIDARLHGAAAGDFVVAFYNPVSKRRRDHLARARDVLLTGRPGTTPVVLARNLGRPDESVTFTTLAELSPDMADMLTLVMVGNRESRLVEQGGRVWLYTPRGYAAKLTATGDAQPAGE
ncbi:Cobalt-precorrin-3b C17-methyltransferase [Caenispirillum salinarum AK4]|uniref:Cobalt-precorrin-3b C17-methyltransferase n=1 Tax=Caenispirillum salinarum AK4 TaxID=1238182 RepID=K9GLK2_9PROT|nr:precorrin-3B C(17)-methyltransferase [Caenispirillum salinarum]EKV26890.1 Cobalt-precorrin-3b C17-methyltransferase [Caenispirillum salinarum AK4]